MSWKRKVSGGLVGLVGFILSPLSWWNDLFVNVPLAVGFGWLVGRFYAPAFEPAVVLGYWLTNLLGFILMHLGARQAFSNQPAQPYWRRGLLRDLTISLLYTMLIVGLVRLKVLQPIEDYFRTPAP